MSIRSATDASVRQTSNVYDVSDKAVPTAPIAINHITTLAAGLRYLATFSLPAKTKASVYFETTLAA